ncbi:MAG TPA: peptidylprolyl isomerase [Bdellovibrionota bacterium]|jgi:peptidyl-prolyl cis-trans isomerase C/peptidyl-prolyl cis-trans isomerase D|nr:peptidylprolyl isomerase [Bdellovibrionota bacterium]
MSFYRFGTLALGLALSLSAVAQDKNTVAQINDKKISVGEFEKRFEQNSQLVPGQKPTKQDVLKNVIYFELATQEARRLNLHRDDDLREQFDILLYQALVRKNVQPKIDQLKIAEKDVREYYEASPLLRTQHIILLTRPDMSTADVTGVRNRATKILSEIREGKGTFDSYVEKYSEGPSAKTGGDVDWGARHKLLPEYYDAALALKKVGDVSDVVATPYGFHVIKLTGRKPYKEIDSVYKDFIIRTLKEQRGQAIYEEYFNGLRSKARVTVNEDLLK